MSLSTFGTNAGKTHKNTDPEIDPKPLPSLQFLPNFCPMTPEEIKRYFDTTPPPEEVELKPWARITDSQLFLKSCFLTISIPLLIDKPFLDGCKIFIFQMLF